MSNPNFKRKNGGASEEITGREKKKLRMSEARNIPVQTATTPSQAGPSRVIPTKNSLEGLPSAIDVEKFAEARAFEINAMQIAMKTANAGSTQRAWQALPRHLRRRAASHDVRRVPVRLRERARAEMDAKPGKPNRGPKRGKLKMVSRTESFLKRQKDKTWLETHIWHSKRMHMENMWGYRLATHPTEKAYRPSHRASVQGSIIHDASYFSLVELRGPENALITLLEGCCDPQSPSPGSVTYRRGARTLETHIYAAGAYPYDLISPISIMWQPVAEPADKAVASTKPTQHLAAASSSTQIPAYTLSDQERIIWLRFHPSVHDEVMGALKDATAQYLSTRKAVPETLIHLTEMKDQINVFEIMGPKASSVIKGALSPVSSDHRDEFCKWWASLGDVQSTGSLPRNMVIGVKVVDPRLKFPPKNAKATKTSSTEHHPANSIFPSAPLARSEIWDEMIRLGIAKPKYQKKDLDARRADNTIPGTKLEPLRGDDRVPILLIQRSLEGQGAHATRSGSIHGWTLIVPSGWGMTFWNSLTYTGTRVAGQRERQVQAYEAGTAYFPREYPFNSACQASQEQRETELKERWESKPPAKRVNFEKLGVKHPWRPEWRRILGLADPQEDTESVDLVPAQRGETQTGMSGTLSAYADAKPWLLRGAQLKEVVDNVASSFMHGEALLKSVNSQRTRRALPPLPSTLKGAALLQGALVNVMVTMVARGVPEDFAIVYMMEDEEVSGELKGFAKMQGVEEGMFDDEDAEDVAPTYPRDEKIIGRVTTGHQSLSRGCGFGIAAIPLIRLLELKAQMARVQQRGKPPRAPLVKIRNIDSALCRTAKIELLLEV